MKKTGWLAGTSLTCLVSTLALSLAGANAVGADGAAPAALVAKGERLYVQCRDCHTVDEGDDDRVGPNLYGVPGKAAASRSGFPYSASLRAAGLTWDDATLDRWLENPRAVVPETSMAFVGIKDPEDRRALIAYLRAVALAE
jgi:cytochrome c